ncbi:MAG: PrsW family glutamic-type intramembrane protease, partial [Actinomycetota bacterium]
MTRRYLPAGVAAALTITADLLLLLGGVRSFPLLLVAAAGPPAAALLLGRGAAGGEAAWWKMALGVLIGATAVPALVMATHTLFGVAAWTLVDPLGAAGTELLDQLEVDRTLLAVLTNPWAMWFLVDLAVVAPLCEEFFKPLGAFWVRATSRREAFLIGASVGAGFAAVENMLYASGWWWSLESWLPIAVLRSSGAALHLLGAGLVSLAIYERRTGKGRSSIAKTYGLAGGIHALWNGSIAVVIILFSERQLIAGGLAGTSLSWGIALGVFLGALGV